MGLTGLCIKQAGSKEGFCSYVCRRQGTLENNH